MKIAIITDSVAYLSNEEQTALQVHVLPLTIAYEEHVYTEGVDLTAEQFYPLVRGGKTLPKSSQPTVGETLKLFEQLAKEYDAAIAIHLSSEISGTFQTTMSMSQEFDNFKVYGVDSRRACGAQAQLVREAARLINLGQTPEVIVKRLEQMVTAQNAYFLVDDLMHLQKGGRLSVGSAVVGSMLNIKPILTIDGKITPVEKIRTFKKGVSRIVELVNEHIRPYDVPFTVTLHHANALEKAEDIKQLLAAVLPEETTYIISEFGAVIGTHLGEHAIGVIFSPTTSDDLKN